MIVSPGPSPAPHMVDPATTVTWRRDGVVITPNATYQQTKRVVDSVWGVYQTVLTINSSVDQSNIAGIYYCTVENARGRSSGMAVIPGNGEYIPIYTLIAKLCIQYMYLPTDYQCLLPGTKVISVNWTIAVCYINIIFIESAAALCIVSAQLEGNYIWGLIPSC